MTTATITETKVTATVTDDAVAATTADTTVSATIVDASVTGAQLALKADADADGVSGNLTQLDGSGNAVDAGYQLGTLRNTENIVANEFGSGKYELDLTPTQVIPGTYSTVTVDRFGRVVKGNASDTGIFTNGTHTMFIYQGDVYLDYGRFALRHSGLVIHYPLTTDASEQSSTTFDGTASNVTFDAADGPTNTGADRVPSFNGSTSHIDIFSSVLQSVYPFSAGSVIMPVKPSAAGIWNSSTRREFYRAYSNASNGFRLRHSNVANTLQVQYTAGGTTLSIDYLFGAEPTDWVWLGATWGDSANGDQLKLYVDGAQVGTTQTGAGAYGSTTLNSSRTLIGRDTTTGSDSWSGNIGRVTIVDRILTDAEMKYLHLQQA